MGITSIWHWLILLVVVIAVFGTSKLKNAGKDLGQAVKGFKDAIKDEETPKLSQSEEVKVEEVKVKKDETA